MSPDGDHIDGPRVRPAARRSTPQPQPKGELKRSHDQDEFDTAVALQSRMLLEPMLSRLNKVVHLNDALHIGLRDFVALHGAEMGDMQLVGADGRLVIVQAHRLTKKFLQVFRRVSPDSGSACGRAARDRRPIFIADVATDPEYTPYVAFAAAVPFTSVLSCPLFRQDGALVGMISALSAQRFSPSALELEAASAYANVLTSKLLGLLTGEAMSAFAERKSAELVDAAEDRSIQGC